MPVEHFELLRDNPAPILLNGGKTILCWTPKSACSHAVMWAFATEGLLNECQSVHSFPHRYRRQFYYDSLVYKNSLETLKSSLVDELTLIQITRNPLDRMVSIFRHILKAKFLDGNIKEVLDIDIDLDGISLIDFDRYLGYLYGTDSDKKIDHHLRSQFRPISKLPFGRTIILNIDSDDMDDVLRRIEADIGLTLNLNLLNAAVQKLRSFHYNQSEMDIDKPVAIETLKLTRDQIASFPKTRLRASPLTGEMVSKYHHEDMVGTLSHDSSGVIFSSPF